MTAEAKEQKRHHINPFKTVTGFANPADLDNTDDSVYEKKKGSKHIRSDKEFKGLSFLPRSGSAKGLESHKLN